MHLRILRKVHLSSVRKKREGPLGSRFDMVGLDDMFGGGHLGKSGKQYAERSLSAGTW